MRRTFDILARVTASRRGAAMTETALLCFFLYVPILMMVIVWGDLSLDKERAHVAAAYMTFRTEPMDDATLTEQFFPTATGRQDGTMSVRSAGIDTDEAAEGPVFDLPNPAAGDYAGVKPDFDLQYKLYSLAIGEVNMSYILQAMPDGTVGFMANWNRVQDDVARYLTNNGIVNVPDLPDEMQMAAPVGGEITIDTESDSKAYTYYVETVTNLFNGQWNAGGQSAGGVMGNMMPRYESFSGLTTTFESPFLTELSRDSSGRGWQGRSRDEGLAGGVTMHFGATELTPDDDSFRGGYGYLVNAEARPDCSALRNDLFELSPAVFQYQGEQPGSPLVGIHEMEAPRSSEQGEAHLRYLEPGDPRPQ